MKTRSQDSSLPFVMLEGIEHGNRFICSNIPGEDNTKLANGQIVYRVLGYATSIEEAQELLYDNPNQKIDATEKWIDENLAKIGQENSQELRDILRGILA